MEKGFEREVIERLVKIETKLDEYKETKDRANDAYTKAMENEEKIKEIQDKIKWLTRTIAAAIISGGIALIFSFIK